LQLEAKVGGYEAADRETAAIAQFYEAVAQLLGAQARNIAFASSATDAYARALSAFDWKAGDVILTTENDYVSNQIAFLAMQNRYGVRLLRARDTAAGGVDVLDFEQLLKKHRPKVAAVTHVPTNSGLVQPVAEIGQICRTEGIWYLVDACQSAGQLPLDVAQIGCDFLTATMRKFMRGPRGTGFLFVSDRALEAGLSMTMPDMRGADWTGADTYSHRHDARRFEYWEIPVALQLGAAEAARYALEIGLANIETRVKHLADYTRARLSELPRVRVLDQGTNLCGIVTASADHWSGKELLSYLNAAHINCRGSDPMVAQIDFPRKGVQWALRVSPHYYNTEAEIDIFVQHLEGVKV
jgi:selenocysteine lyase/cysteine desulfurase